MDSFDMNTDRSKVQQLEAKLAKEQEKVAKLEYERDEWAKRARLAYVDGENNLGGMGMKIKVEPTLGDAYRVQMQLATDARWVDFGFMNYIERKELADQLRDMANELLKVKP